MGIMDMMLNSIDLYNMIWYKYTYYIWINIYILPIILVNTLKDGNNVDIKLINLNISVKYNALSVYFSVIYLHLYNKYLTLYIFFK